MKLDPAEQHAPQATPNPFKSITMGADTAAFRCIQIRQFVILKVELVDEFLVAEAQASHGSDDAGDVIPLLDNVRDRRILRYALP